MRGNRKRGMTLGGTRGDGKVIMEKGGGERLTNE
jgi:hypothetical protein